MQKMKTKNLTEWKKSHELKNDWEKKIKYIREIFYRKSKKSIPPCVQS